MIEQCRKDRRCADTHMWRGERPRSCDLDAREQVQTAVPAATPAFPVS